MDVICFDIIFAICEYLKSSDLVSFRQVNNNIWKHLKNDSKIWVLLYKQRFLNIVKENNFQDNLLSSFHVFLLCSQWKNTDRKNVMSSSQTTKNWGSFCAGRGSPIMNFGNNIYCTRGYDSIKYIYDGVGNRKLFIIGKDGKLYIDARWKKLSIISVPSRGMTDKYKKIVLKLAKYRKPFDEIDVGIYIYDMKTYKINSYRNDETNPNIDYAFLDITSHYDMHKDIKSLVHHANYNLFEIFKKDDFVASKNSNPEKLLYNWEVLVKECNPILYEKYGKKQCEHMKKIQQYLLNKK